MFIHYFQLNGSVQKARDTFKYNPKTQLKFSGSISNNRARGMVHDSTAILQSLHNVGVPLVRLVVPFNSEFASSFNFCWSALD